MMCTSLLALALAGASVASVEAPEPEPAAEPATAAESEPEPEPAAEAEAEPAEPVDYGAALDGAEQAFKYANNFTSTDTKNVIEKLRTALEELESIDRETLLAEDDGYGWNLMLDLRLSLARALLESKDEGGAEEILDELLRLPSEAPVNLAQFGTDGIVGLAESRRQALEAQGKGRITLVCHVACYAIVNGQAVLREELELYLGRYELEIRPTVEGGPAAEQYVVELTEPGQKETIEFAKPKPKPDEDEDEDEDDEDEVEENTVLDDGPIIEDGPKRMLPLWAEVTGIVAGVGVAAVGPGLLSYDGKCENIDQDVTTCPQVWESTAGGATMIAVGATVAITSAVLLVIDQRRARTKPSGRRARLTPTGAVRF